KSSMVNLLKIVNYPVAFTLGARHCRKGAAGFCSDDCVLLGTANGIARWDQGPTTPSPQSHQLATRSEGQGDPLPQAEACPAQIGPSLTSSPLACSSELARRMT